MYQKHILWLLCATILTAQPAFAADKAKASTDKTATSEQKQKASGLTLEVAIAKALEQSPRLQAFGSGVAAAKGEYRQSDAFQNPELSVQAENVAGDGQYKDFASAEVTYGISQELEIGGQRSARRSIAGKGLEIASLEYQAAALDVIRDITAAYADAVAADEAVRLASEQKALAWDVLKSVSARVGAAAAPLIQKSRAEVELSTAAISLDTATRERDIAHKNLATVMGEEQAVITLDSTAFYAVTKPDVVATAEKLSSNPNLQKLNASLEQSRARLELESASAIPNPRFNVGVRDFRDSGNQAFVVGVSLPIPVLNANRGNIAKARSEISRTEQENRSAALTLNSELHRAGQEMESAYLRAETLKKNVLPAASKAFQLAREGYGLGRFPYLEVLDAQRSLFGVKQQHITALKELHTARASVERLTAAHAEKVQNKGEQK